MPFCHIWVIVLFLKFSYKYIFFFLFHLFILLLLSILLYIWCLYENALNLLGLRNIALRTCEKMIIDYFYFFFPIKWYEYEMCIWWYYLDYFLFSLFINHMSSRRNGCKFSSDNILSSIHSQEQTQGQIAPNVPFPTRFVTERCSIEHWFLW